MGYPKIAEAGQYPEAPRSERIAVETRGRFTLEHVTESYTPAGSAMRWRTPGWVVAVMIDGARHSRAYWTEAEARGEFDRVTAGEER
jgi:hypothetical protein